MSWFRESIGVILSVLLLVGTGLVILAAFGRVRFPYFGGVRMPWHDIDVMLTARERKVCMIIGPLLWAMALFLLLLVSFPGQ